MMKYSILFLSTLLFNLSWGAEASNNPAAEGKDKLTVAITDLLAKGVEASTADIISERFRSELLKTGHFRVMERGQMDMILKEQGFQQSGVCADAACLVEMGQMMGVDRMLAGSLGKLGSMYTLTVRLINVGTGEILITANEDCDCDIKDVLSRVVPSLAQQLAQAAGFTEELTKGNYARRTSLGLAFLGASVISGAVGGILFAGASEKFDTYNNFREVSQADYQATVDELYSDYQSAFISSWIVTGAAVALLAPSGYFFLKKQPAAAGAPAAKATASVSVKTE